MTGRPQVAPTVLYDKRLDKSEFDRIKIDKKTKNDEVLPGEVPGNGIKLRKYAFSLHIGGRRFYCALYKNLPHFFAEFQKKHLTNQGRCAAFLLKSQKGQCNQGMCPPQITRRLSDEEKN